MWSYNEANSVCLKTKNWLVEMALKLLKNFHFHQLTIELIKTDKEFGMEGKTSSPVAIEQHFLDNHVLDDW